MKTSDEILVQKVLDGDELSFKILVERYKRSVFLHAVKTTRDFHDAEDITQDVFVEAYLNLRKLREPAKFGSWLRGITKNLCRIWTRKKRMLSDLEIPLDNLQTEILNQWLKEQENSESWEFGTDVINKLSDEQKVLLQLFYIDNLSCREIAQLMGTTEVAIRQRLSRTRRQLRAEILEGEKNMNRMIAIGAICAFLLGSALPVSGGTWRDNFRDSNLDGWEMDTCIWQQKVVKPNVGNWVVENGVVIGGDDDFGTRYDLYTGQMSWTDYTAEVSVKLSKELRFCQASSGVWLGVRWQGDGLNGYCLGIINAEWVGLKEVAYSMIYDKGDRGHRFPGVAFPTKAGKWYRLRVTVSKNQVRCFVDDIEVDVYKNNLFPSGMVVIAVHGVKAMFDDFAVTGPNIPDGGPGFAVNPQAKLATAWGDIKSH